MGVLAKNGQIQTNFSWEPAGVFHDRLTEEKRPSVENRHNASLFSVGHHERRNQQLKPWDFLM